MTNKLLILCSLLLIVLAACGPSTGDEDEAAVTGESTVIEVFHSPT